jgi:hypothetical protein
MAYAFTTWAIQQFAEHGYDLLTSYSPFYIDLLKTSAPSPDPALTWASLTGNFADYKGYSEAACTSSTSWDAGTDTEFLTFSTATFPYNSASSGSASNTIDKFCLSFYQSGTYYLALVGELPSTWTVDSDGQVPTIPLSIAWRQKIECP